MICLGIASGCMRASNSVFVFVFVFVFVVVFAADAPSCEAPNTPSQRPNIGHTPHVALRDHGLTVRNDGADWDGEAGRDSSCWIN